MTNLHLENDVHERTGDAWCAARRSGIRAIANSPAEGERQQYLNKAASFVIAKT